MPQECLISISEIQPSHPKSVQSWWISFGSHNTTLLHTAYAKIPNSRPLFGISRDITTSSSSRNYYAFFMLRFLLLKPKWLWTKRCFLSTYSCLWMNEVIHHPEDKSASHRLIIAKHFSLHGKCGIQQKSMVFPTYTRLLMFIKNSCWLIGATWTSVCFCPTY